LELSRPSSAQTAARTASNRGSEKGSHLTLKAPAEEQRSSAPGALRSASFGARPAGLRRGRDSPVKMERRIASIRIARFRPGGLVECFAVAPLAAQQTAVLAGVVRSPQVLLRSRTGCCFRSLGPRERSLLPRSRTAAIRAARFDSLPERRLPQRHSELSPRQWPEPSVRHHSPACPPSPTFRRSAIPYCLPSSVGSEWLVRPEHSLGNSPKHPREALPQSRRSGWQQNPRSRWQGSVHAVARFCPHLQNFHAPRCLSTDQM